MNIKRILSIFTILAASFTTNIAKADATYDAHGNVGYDTAAECDAAVQSGSAKFYQPFTHKKPLLRTGEKSVQTATLKDLGSQYAKGACDVGVGKRAGRDGVSTVLQGKFIPFSPDMPVNVYNDASGNAVRVTMGQCDNWFSTSAPRPVTLVQQHTQQPIANETVVTATEPTAPIPMATAALISPYVFGTIGIHTEHMDANGKQPAFYNRGIYNDSSRTVTGQVGVGLQFNPYVGGEVYFEGGKNKKYTSTTGTEQKVNRRVLGSRLILGTNADAKVRIFTKVGVAAVHQDDFHPQWVLGLGGSYKITDKTAIRVDYDHNIKRSPHVYYDNMGFSKSHYFGFGLQHHFK